MSGIEVAGLILGAVPLALKSYRELATLVTDYNRYGLQGLKIRHKYANQADLFKVSIRRLFTNTFDKNVVTAMLSDPMHRMWADSDVRERLGTVLDRDLDLCDAVNRNVALIKQKLDKVLSILKTVGLEQASHLMSPQTSSQPRSLNQSCAKKLQKAMWAFRGKSKVESLLDEATAANQDLEKFVSAIQEYRKSERPTQHIIGEVDDVKAIQDDYTRLYKALSVTWAGCGCPAHDVELALQCGVNQGSAGSLKQTTRDCGVIFHVGPLSKCCYAHSDAANQTQHRQDTLVMDEENNTEHCGTDLCKTSNGSAQHILVKQKGLPDDHISQCVDSICSGLQALGWSAQAVCQCHQHISSQITCPSEPHGIHVSSCNSHFSGISWSLAEVLSRDRTQCRLTEVLKSPYQRLKLAYVLALSLLRLYSSPWLGEEERWSSDDVRFVINPSSNAESTAIPHLTACRRKIGASQNASNTKVSECVDNYQIYALGVLLLELAIEGVLVSLPSPEENHSLELAEFLEALRLIKNSKLGKGLGPRYARIVSRCIKFDFGVGERNLKHVSLQRAFYRHVVCELEGCLNSLSLVK